MAVNKNHPDYPAYAKKHKGLWDVYLKREEEELAKYPDHHGQDHPAYIILRPLHKQFCAEVKALQREYSHLFTEEDV